jgi:hypothetical protein
VWVKNLDQDCVTIPDLYYKLLVKDYM